MERLVKLPFYLEIYCLGTEIARWPSESQADLFAGIAEELLRWDSTLQQYAQFRDAGSRLTKTQKAVLRKIFEAMLEEHNQD